MASIAAPGRRPGAEAAPGPGAPYRAIGAGWPTARLSAGLDIAVDDAQRDIVLAGEVGRDAIGHHDRAVAAAGATSRR